MVHSRSGLGCWWGEELLRNNAVGITICCFILVQISAVGQLI